MQLIYIEPSDEITTVIERMKEASDLSLALIVPKGAILLQSIINLKLAKKAANDVNKEICLVTTDKIGRNLATQVGIPIYNKLNKQNIPEEGDVSEEDSKVVSGVRVHRYYEDEKKENETIEDMGPSVTPIIPKAVFQEGITDKQQNSEVTQESPIIVRPLEITIPKINKLKDQNHQIIEIISKENRQTSSKIDENSLNNHLSSSHEKILISKKKAKKYNQPQSGRKKL